MGKEYYFRQTPGCIFALGAAFTTSGAGDDACYLVSNDESVQAEVYAPEINFYIRSSADSDAKKVENIKRLYEVRATGYDLAQQTNLTAEIGRKVIVISAEDQQSLCQDLEKHAFTTIVLHPDQLREVTGSIGRWKASVEIDTHRAVLDADQILWFKGPKSLTRRRGIHDPDVLGITQTIAELLAGCGSFTYSNCIRYNVSACQYHHRRTAVCGYCADRCPTGAITKDDSEKELRIADIDCNGCSGCAGICPTGAIDYAPLPRAAFRRILSFYKDRSALILPGRTDIDTLQANLHENVLPLFLNETDFLDECHFLSLLQKSGYPVLFHTSTVASLTEDVITFLNEIFLKKFNRPGIYICHNGQELSEIASRLSPFPEIFYDLDERSLGKKEIFARRLAHLLGKDDLGIVHTGPHLHYGSISINEETCTLCLSCADACNAGALTVHAEDNTLRYLPALCTACGYCQTTCPENNCVHIEKDQLTLRPDFCKQKVMAKDEIFKCIECGKGFAPAKAINKIADLMRPLFGEDRVRIKSLSCCPDCKARVMLESLQTNNPLK